MLEKLPVTENYYYVAIIAIFTFALTMITAKGSLTNHRYKWYKWKRYTFRGKQAISLGFLVAFALFLQDINNRNISKVNDQKLSDKEILRTKEIKAGVKKATDQLFDGLSTAFKKQGLQYDTIKKQVFKLRDSIRVTEINHETPLIVLTKLEIKDSINLDRYYTVEYEVNSFDAKSLNIDLKFDIFAFTKMNNILTIEKNKRIFYKGQTIAKELGISNIWYVPKDTNLYSLYVFRLKGSYYSSNNQKLTIDQFYVLVPQKRKEVAFRSVSQNREDRLRLYIDEN